MITLQGAIEKSPILLSQYWKNERLDSTIIISHFGGSNNICWHVIEILSHLVDKITRIKGYKLYLYLVDKITRIKGYKLYIFRYIQSKRFRYIERNKI